MSTTTDGANEGARGRSTARGSVHGAAGWLEADRDTRGAHRTAVTRQAASVLLGHPGRTFFERLPLVARAVAELPWGAVRTALRDFCEHASTTPEPRLCEHHTEVFGRRPPYLARYGDTAWRDRVLAETARAYAEAGWPVPDGERPDHLVLVLEFAALADARAGEELLLRLRPGLDLLGEALHDRGTPYARVVDAVRMTLPGDAEAGRTAHRYAVLRPSDQDAAPPVPLPRAGTGADADASG